MWRASPRLSQPLTFDESLHHSRELKDRARNLAAFADIPAQSRVVVALSGGIDSAVTAALACAAGYEVVAITLQLYDHGAAVARPGSCCAGRDIRDARRIAEHLGIAHYVLDFEERFRTAVIEPFAAAYAAGRTPLPCALCNREIKFKDLLRLSQDLGAAALLTGHYARRVPGSEGVELHRAQDHRRDQSYFLFATLPSELENLRFPLGDWEKTETRKLAQEILLPVAHKSDSQDLCFVPQKSYKAVVARHRPETQTSGPIVDLEGHILGTHDGISGYTIGQRHGLGISHPVPLYVVALEPSSQRVVVGPRMALLRDRVWVEEINWLSTQEARKLRAVVRLRSSEEPHPAIVLKDQRLDATDYPENGTAPALRNSTLLLKRPQAGVAPGQAAVFYRASRLLGGGWIKRAGQSSRLAARISP